MRLSTTTANQRFIAQYQQRGNSQIRFRHEEPLSLPDACPITSPIAIFRTDASFALQYAFGLQRLHRVPNSTDCSYLRYASYKPVPLVMPEQKAMVLAVLAAQQQKVTNLRLNIQDHELGH